MSRTVDDAIRKSKDPREKWDPQNDIPITPNLCITCGKNVSGKMAQCEKCSALSRINETTPEDARINLQIARKVVSKYVLDKGCENCWGDLHQGCTDECKANWKLSNEVADLLTTARAEGKREGVKAMVEKVKDRMDITDDSRHITSRDIEFAADQLLNQPKTTP